MYVLWIMATFRLATWLNWSNDVKVAMWFRTFTRTSNLKKSDFDLFITFLPSKWMENLGYQNKFSRKFVFRYSLKICWKTDVSLTYEKSEDYFTRRPLFIYDISLSSSQNVNFSKYNCRKKAKNTLYVQSCCPTYIRLTDNAEENRRSGKGTEKDMGLPNCMLDN